MQYEICMHISVIWDLHLSFKIVMASDSLCTQQGLTPVPTSKDPLFT
jgi:hypothetical protein